MATKLYQSLIYANDLGDYYDPDFQQVIDSHRQYLLTTGNYVHEVVQPAYLGQYLGDFYALLNDLNIHAQYHRIILILNGYTNPIQYDGDLRRVFIPDTALMDRILSIYGTGKDKLKLGTPGQ